MVRTAATRTLRPKAILRPRRVVQPGANPIAALPRAGGKRTRIKKKIEDGHKQRVAKSGAVLAVAEK